MEVHHPHHLHKKKKWTEYFLEGFMIFVAVSLGYAAENIREHHLESQKALKSLKNLYVEVSDDSARYHQNIGIRRYQDSFFRYVNNKYEKNEINKFIPEFYVAHHYMVYRAYPSFNTNSLEQIKNNGLINFIEDDSLKLLIQNYSQDVREMYLRGEREAGFIDRMIDPITSKFFYYKYYGNLTEKSQVYANGEIKLNVEIPRSATLNKANEFDWASYITIMGQLSSIRNSSEFYFLEPARKHCHALLAQIRKYMENKD